MESESSSRRESLRRLSKLSTAFGASQQRALALGLRERNIQRLETILLLRVGHRGDDHPMRMNGYGKVLVAAFVATVLLVCLLGCCNSSIRQTFTDFAEPYLGPWLGPGYCLLSLGERGSYYFRPISDCGFCQNVNSIARVVNISREDFESQYVDTGRSVVISDGQFNWPDHRLMDFDRLRRLYTETGSSPMLEPSLSSKSVRQPCEMSRFTEGYKNPDDMFGHTVDDLNSTGQWFVGWGNCDQRVQLQLEEMFPLPYFLKNRKIITRYWFHMASRAHGSPYHIDSVDYIWQAQLQGQKRWYFQPPPECYFSCKYYIEAVVNAGETVFSHAALWFHGTEVLGKDFSIALTAKYDKLQKNPLSKALDKPNN